MTGPDDDQSPHDRPTGGTSRSSASLLAFGLAYPTLLTLVYFVGLAGAPQPVQQGVYLAGKILQFGLPAAMLLWPALRARPLAWPGGRGALLGLGVGLAVLVAGLVLYRAVLVPGQVLQGGPAAAMRAKVLGLGVAGPWRYLALAIFYCLVHSAAEEFYWRWFVFGELLRRGHAGRAIIWSSAGFAAHHVVLLSVFFGWTSPWTWALSLAVAAGGAFWAWLYHRSGSLLGPWLGHLLVDALVFAVGWDLVR